MKYAKIIVISVICIMIGGIIFMAGFSIAGFNLKSLSTDGEIINKTYTAAEKINAVKVSDENTEIEIKPTDGENIYVEYEEDDIKKYDVKENDGTLSIEGKETRKWYQRIFCFNFHFPKLKIFIPEDAVVSIDAETSNAKISCENLTFENSEMKTSNGKIEIKKVASLSGVDLESSNGSISLSNVEAEDEIKIKTSNGKIKISDVKTGDSLDFKTSNGKIEFENIFAEKDISLKTSNGAIKGTINDKITNYSIDSDTSNGSNNLPSQNFGGEKKLKVDTSNGKIDVEFTN